MLLTELLAFEVEDAGHHYFPTFLAFLWIVQNLTSSRTPFYEEPTLIYSNKLP